MTHKACEAVLEIARSLEAGDRSLVLAVKASKFGLDTNLAECDSPIALMRLSLAWKTQENLTNVLTTHAREKIVTGSHDPSMGKFLNDLQRRAILFGTNKHGEFISESHRTSLLSDTAAVWIMIDAISAHEKYEQTVDKDWAKRVGIPYMKFFRARFAKEWNNLYPNKSIKAMVVNIQQIIGKPELIYTTLKHMPAGPFTPKSFIAARREQENDEL